MIQKRRILVNAGMAVVQVVVNGLVAFVMYRFLYRTLGIDDIGVWAVVLSWNSINHLANLGMTGSATKYVSQYLAREDRGRVAQVIQTSVLSVAVAMGVLVLLMYPVLREVLAFFIEPATKIPAALDILPYALAAFWLAALGAIFQASIDGFQRVDIRHILTMIAGIMYLGLIVWWVPQRGLVGLAQAQLAQAGFLCVVAWLVVRRLHRGLPLLPWRWDQGMFREMFRYSISFQGTSLAQMLLDPMTKLLLAKFGGVSASGVFELAHKLVIQLRALVVTAHWALVPTIADVQERNPALIRAIYQKSFRLVQFLVVVSLPLLLGLTPLIAEIWLGEVPDLFVLFTTLIATGWFLNMYSNPAYFANVGTGELRWNVWGHLATGVTNGVVGVLLGWLFGGTGIVVAYMVAILLGSGLVMVMYQREKQIAFSEVVAWEDLYLGGAALVGLAAIAGLYVQLHATLAWLPLALLVLIAYGAAVAWFVWRHSMWHQMLGWARHLLKRQGAVVPADGDAEAQ